MNDKDKYRYDYEKRMQLGVILLLNVPSEMKFGIDMSEWTISNLSSLQKMLKLDVGHFMPLLHVQHAMACVTQLEMRKKL